MSDGTDPYGGQLSEWAAGVADAVDDRYRGASRRRRRDVADLIERAGARLLILRRWKSIEDQGLLGELTTQLRAEASRLPMGGQLAHLRHEASRELQEGIVALTEENARLQKCAVSSRKDLLGVAVMDRGRRLRRAGAAE